MSAPPTTPPPLPSFDFTLGPEYVGAVIASFLYGMVCLQLYNYYTSARGMQDGPIMKIFVAVLFLVSTAALCIIGAAGYTLLVTDFARLQDIANPANKAFFLLHVDGYLSEIISLFVELFYALRVAGYIQNVQHWSKHILMSVITSLALGAFGVQTVYVRTSMEQDAFFTSHEVTQRLSHEFTAGVALRIACDVTITVSMVSFLWRSRTGLKKTDSALKMLIKFAINTGLLFTVLGIALLVTFLVWPNLTVYGCVALIVQPLYVNSALAALNGRASVASKLDFQTDVLLSDIQFHPQPTRQTVSSGTAVTSTDGKKIQSHPSRTTRMSETTTIPLNELSTGTHHRLDLESGRMSRDSDHDHDHESGEAPPPRQKSPPV